MIVTCFIAQSLSLVFFHHLNVIEMLFNKNETFSIFFFRYCICILKEKPTDLDLHCLSFSM